MVSVHVLKFGERCVGSSELAMWGKCRIFNDVLNHKSAQKGAGVENSCGIHVTI